MVAGIEIVRGGGGSLQSMNISCRMTASGLRSFLPGFSIYKFMLSGNRGGGRGGGIDGRGWGRAGGGWGSVRRLASCLENSLGNPNVNEHILEMCKY